MQKIASAFFCESKFYNLNDFSKRLKIDEECARKVIARLLAANIIKPTSRRAFDMDELQSEEIILEEPFFLNYENGFSFCFVGIICTENCVLKCLPKYFENDADEKPFEKNPKNILHFKKVLKAIQKYKSAKSENLYLYYDAGQKENFNRLAMEIFLLEDYFSNGIYTNERETIETNGEGQIDWNRTIGETFAFIKNGKPHYVDLQTFDFRNDSQNFFRLLHECILTKCSRELQNIGILDLFDIAPAEFCVKGISDFGGIDYILCQLEAEIKNQFVTKKQNLLRAMYAFLSETEMAKTESGFSFYGTNAFNLVWETACSAIFCDVKEARIASLEQRGILQFKNYDLKRDSTLESFIEKVKWEFAENVVNSRETLEPDIITIHGGVFYILDGKYYVPHYSDNAISNQPGIQDVVKQFAYHKAFYNLLQVSSLEKVANMFLLPQSFPNNGENVELAGTVKLNLMQNFALESLCPISLVKLNPDFVFENYLQGKSVSDELKNIEASAIQKPAVSTYDWQNDFIPRLDFTMAGFLRESYIEQIRTRQKDFIFFFYHKKDGTTYPVHNLLPCCGKFIGYNPQRNFFVRGKIAFTEGEPPIKILDKAELLVELQKSGYENATHENADSYYAVKITAVKIEEANSDAHKKLKDAIANFDGNDILSDHSPKALGEFQDLPNP